MCERGERESRAEHTYDADLEVVAWPTEEDFFLLDRLLGGHPGFRFTFREGCGGGGEGRDEAGEY